MAYLKKLTRVAFLLCFSFFLLLSPQKTYASELGGNAGGESAGDGTQLIIGGPASVNTGWLTYIIDENNAVVTDTKVFYSSSARPSGGHIMYPSTKFGGSTNGYSSNAVAPWSPSTPFSDTGGANGGAVKSWMLQNDNALNFVQEQYGTAMLERFTKEKLFLIIEPFYWGQMYNGMNPLGVYLIATAHGWAHYQAALGLGEYGSPLIRRFTNNTYPNCVKLEFTQFGYTPAYGTLTNSEIMTSGNGFMAIWASESIELPEDVEEVNDQRQLYAIKNWSNEFDISEGIPSGEMVNNAYEADAFFANSKVKTVDSKEKKYSAVYTYKYLETFRSPQTNEDGTYKKDENGNIVYNYWQEWVTCGYNNINFKASTSYQLLTNIELYAFDNLKTLNNAFAFATAYDKTNSSTWYDVSAEVRRYRGNGGYSNNGLLECKDIGEDHYYLPDPSIIQSKVIHVSSQAEAFNRMDSDKRAAMQTVYNASWSRNDHLVVKAGSAEYVFMKDTKVPGCYIAGFGNATAADSNYRYGGAGLLTDSVKPVRSKGEMEVIIPPSTDNANYPTGVTAIYKNIANTKNDMDVVLRAGRGIYPSGTVDDIYKHIIDSSNSYGQAHNRVDKPAGDGYDIKVHTPVISPIMITSNLGTPQWYADEQLLDVENVDFQLKLDANYMVRWNLDQWVSFKYGELMGYEENGGFPSRYDEYVEKKELKFPFDVYYDSVFYKAGTWIEITAPNDTLTVWNAGLSLDQRNNYVSHNHWQMTPIYIPSYATEGTGSIQARVYAKNVEGRYEGSHNVAEAMELTKNTYQDNYIATYAVSDQLSGHIYGFTVTGVDDKDMYEEIETDVTIWDRIGHSFSKDKEEKVAGTKNRHGEDSIRYQTDGSLTKFTQNEDGSYHPDYNLLPLREGSNKTASLHTGDGRLWTGTGFVFNLKTIANLWGNNDYVQITPTFKFYDKQDGTLVDVIRMNGDTVESKNDRIKMFFLDESMIRDFFNTSSQKRYYVRMGSNKFEESYYTSADTLQAGGVFKRFGNWVDYTLERWNKTNSLYGSAAKTKTELMDYAWPCYTNTLITLDANLRMLSGEWDQLQKNRNRVGSNVATYYDFNEDNYTDQGIRSTMETEFRDSMQTWFGGYWMPGYILIYDNINHDFELKSSFSDSDFSTNYDIVINFDIVAYQNGRPHLGYGGYINGGRMWDKEGYDNKDGKYDDGDVVTYDGTHSARDKFEGHLINVN